MNVTTPEPIAVGTQQAPTPDGAQPALLLTARDTARALAISERTLWGLTDAGAIPCVRLGRAVRYDRRDLVGFIDSQKGT